MTPEEALHLLERHGALLSGHFLLSSGLHSDRYVQTARILERPPLTMSLAREIGSWYQRIDVVAAPAVGAITLGFAVALAAEARAVYAEREAGRMQLRRGFRVAPQERVLVVDNVITTGESAGEVDELVGELGAERLGVAALVDRSRGPMPYELRALARVEAETWDPQACPRCAQGVPLDSPGSRHVLRR